MRSVVIVTLVAIMVEAIEGWQPDRGNMTRPTREPTNATMAFEDPRRLPHEVLMIAGVPAGWVMIVLLAIFAAILVLCWWQPNQRDYEDGVMVNSEGDPIDVHHQAKHFHKKSNDIDELI